MMEFEGNPDLPRLLAKKRMLMDSAGFELRGLYLAKVAIYP